MNKDLGTLSYMKSFINTTPFKRDKNDRSRFLGEGINYKAKLIGILEVSEARGDRMCQEALADLKMAIRAAGEHKQRININIAIDGLRLRDEKTGDCLYHHPVHKISFIAQDMTDSRAFGYIFGSPDTGHRFFGIKTDKAASQVVISMRDLFQVVFDLKKKEIEMAKQHIEQHQMKYSFPLDSHLGSATNSSGNISSTTKGSEEAFKRPESPKNSFDIFTDLDPLGTGRSRPYVDKKDFFQDLKNPPKKLLKDLVGDVAGEITSPGKPDSSPSNVSGKQELNADTNLHAKVPQPSNGTDSFLNDPFDKDPFIEEFSQGFIQSFSSEDPFEKFADFGSFDSKKQSSENIKKSPGLSMFKQEKDKLTPLKVSLPPEKLVSADSSGGSPATATKSSKLQKHNTISGTPIKLPSPKQKPREIIYSQISSDSFSENFMSPGFEILSNEVPAPEPPPRNVTNSVNVKPPPLPPKKLLSSSLTKPPARPPPSDYDYIENYQSTNYSGFNSPPLPAPARKPKHAQKDSEYYLQPFPLLPPPNKKVSSKESVSTSEPPPEAPLSPGPTKSLDITLSQLTKTGFSDLAASLNMSPTSLSKMTLQDLTRCLSSLSKNENKSDPSNGDNATVADDGKPNVNSPDQTSNDVSFSAEFDAHFGSRMKGPASEESLFDKYAVFRELVQQEQMLAQNSEDSPDNAPVSGDSETLSECSNKNSIRFESTLKESFSQQPSVVSNPAEDRYAALRDICIDDVVLENDDNSDKEESVVETCRLEEDTDLLPSHPHSESTDSPTITTKEPQSVMETTIIEEDISALDADEDDVPDEAIAEALSEQETDKLVTNSETAKELPSAEVTCPSPVSENIEVKSSVEVEACSTTSWAKFETTDNSMQKPMDCRADGNVSPWSAESKDNDVSPTYHDKKKYQRPRRQKIPDDDDEDDDDRDEQWNVRMEPRSWSPSWRENGWSDADSLCDDAPPYVRDYHFSRKGRRRRVSPWNSREQSPWEEDDRELSEDQWEEGRWVDEGRQQWPTRFKGPIWDDERRRHYDDIRKTSRKQVPPPWSGDIDRKSSRESLAWEDEERFSKRSYMDRRHRKWDDDNQGRHNRRWRERDRIDQSKKVIPRYYRDRSHEHQWDDDYNEPGTEDINHWPQRPRSCDRSRRQYASLHSTEMEFPERRYARPPREDYAAESDYRRRAQTLQFQRSRRKHNAQTSPFEDDFTSNFSFSKDANFSMSCSDVFEEDTKTMPVQSEICQKHPHAEVSKVKEYSQFGTCSNLRGENAPVKGSRCCQQSPFEDDFTPPATRRCSGRSVSSDLSDAKSGDDVFYAESKESSFKSKYESRRQRMGGPELFNSSRGTTSRSSSGYASVSQIENTRTKTLSKEREGESSIETPQHSVDKKLSNLRRSDSNSSLKKSESVNIFARNRDPFDDDFFSSSQSSDLDKSKKSLAESSKWTDAFNSFSFDDENK